MAEDRGQQLWYAVRDKRYDEAKQLIQDGANVNVCQHRSFLIDFCFFDTS